MKKSPQEIRRLSVLRPLSSALCPPPSDPRGFTLIELMVVIAVIGIMIGGVFRLLSAAGTGNKRAETISRLEKVQNALSGFYAEFGTYPPVLQHDSPDPMEETDEERNNKDYQKLSAEEKFAWRARRAAACQPVAFYFPSVRSLDDYIALAYEKDQLVSANKALGANAANRPESDWQNGIRVFQFGLMSFLMPRVELMGGEELTRPNPNTDMTPDLNFFSSRQWQKHNAGELAAQRARENHAVARWLPNFEKCITGGPADLMGIDTRTPNNNGFNFVRQTDPKTSSQYMLQSISVQDGWGYAFYYHSMAPYQSYRIWSPGPDGKTFPPWISLEGLSSADRKKVTGWLKDDIARFDRSK